MTFGEMALSFVLVSQWGSTVWFPNPNVFFFQMMTECLFLCELFLEGCRCFYCKTRQNTD